MWKLKFFQQKKCCACIIIYESISQRKRWGWVYARYWSNVEQLCEKWSRDATSGWRSGLANPGSRPPRSSGRPTAPAPYCTASEPRALFYRGNLSCNLTEKVLLESGWNREREREVSKTCTPCWGRQVEQGKTQRESERRGEGWPANRGTRLL